MNEELLKEMIDQNLSFHEIGRKTNKSFTTIRYWANKYNLKSKYREKNKNDKVCPMCNKKLPLDDFYKRTGRKDLLSCCKKCFNKLRVNNLKKIKILMVEYKGGKCEICGYNKCLGALEFHHLDPSQKDYQPARMGKFDEISKKELDKCQLLCSNCHRETHELIRK